MQVKTLEEFDNLVAANRAVVVDFWAPWCGPCVRFAPKFEEMAALHPTVVFAKVNIDEAQEIANRFDIRSIPTLVYILDKNTVKKEIGAPADKETFSATIVEHLG